MKRMGKFSSKISGTLSMRMKVMFLFTIISLICVVTILTITGIRSSQALEKMASNQLESRGQTVKQRIGYFIQQSSTFTKRLAHNRLVEGLFLSYEGAFYGGGFAPGDDQNINNSGYEKLNAIYGGRVKQILTDFSLANVLLTTVDSQIVFSSVEDKDSKLLGRHLISGALKDTSLTKCYLNAMNEKKDKVFFSDFEYLEILGKTVAFLCAKQFAEFEHLSEGIKKGDVMGVVIAELDLSSVNAIMTERVGMGDTGQAYLVGSDRILRSDFYLEKEKFNVDLAFKEKSILQSKSVDMALEGHTGTFKTIDPTNSDVISFHTPFDLFGRRWAVVAEQRLEEVFLPVRNMLLFTLAVSGLLVIAIVFASYFLAKIIVNPVVQANTTLQSISDNVTSHSSDMKINSETLSSGAADIAKNIQSTFSVLEELKSMVRTNLEHVNSSNEKGSRSREAAENGKNSVKEMIEAMDHINVANSEIVGVLNEISSQMGDIINEINKIANKTNVINDIVFQTKLLSFNASVEAARAGEHGKGFAVVAEEVGNLASASGNAAKEISVLLENSIQKVESIVSDTKQKIENISRTGQETVSVGADTAKQCGQALQEILTNVSEVNDKITEISKASNEQAEGIENVSTSIAELNSVTSQTANIAQETLQGSQVLAQGASDLNMVVKDLNQLVHGKDSRSARVDDKPRGGSNQHPPASKNEHSNNAVSDNSFKPTEASQVDQIEKVPSFDDPRFEQTS